MKKKIIIAVIVIILVIVGVIGYIVVSDLGQENKLKSELSELNDLVNSETIDTDEVNDRLDRIVTKGDYAKVEDAFKTYLRNSFDNIIDIVNILNDEKMVTLLTAENYQTDGKDFIESKNYIVITKEKLENCKEKYSEYMTKEKAMSYIENKGLDSYYVDLYEDEFIGDMNSIEDTTVEDSIDEIIDLLNISEKVLNLLSNNKESWTIEGENIVFSNDSVGNQYDELINSIG